MTIAVIGAGFSGMLAAYLLEKAGLKVTIYEKQEVIGGHCRTLESKDVNIELGTVFLFTKQIKELLLELKIEYTERFSYRNFVDGTYTSVELMSRQDASRLLEELTRLKTILSPYEDCLNEINYGHIPLGLMMPLCQFLRKHDLSVLCQVIAPHLSSFGFGNICQVQAYYAFKVFNVDTIYSFVRGEKKIFLNNGTSELIHKLSLNISDIRHSIEVNNIEVVGNKVKVETSFSSDHYDKVLITTKLPRDVIKDDLYNELMKKIDTHPFITCAYEVGNKNLATTYYKNNFGQKDQLQFFYSTRSNNRNMLVAYAYGTVQKQIIDDITHDLLSTGVDVKHLITVKQWYIFPHLKAQNLTQDFYKEINDRQKVSPICLIGSLVSKPAISNLYLSVKQSVKELLSDISDT